MSRGRVLIVEDVKEVRDVVGEIVTRFGYDINLAASGEDAWKMMKSDCFDLIISDIGLPRMRGDELLINMRNQSIETPVILTAGVDLSGSSINWDVLTNYKLLRKPFKLNEIKKNISDLLSSKTQKYN